MIKNKKAREKHHRELRAAKKAFTRAKAERIISACQTSAELTELVDAKGLNDEKLNKHVKAKLAKKLERLAA